ncbi:MAG: hypothetical protein K2N25_04150 [Muribaculaceae bacterium]|nr:hypothetical protein [Muribaculaceae bacterium]
MGYTGQSPYIPINSDDVVAVSGYNNHDWGHFCSGLNSNINKWSLWKPYRIAGNTSPTNLQVAQIKFGIDVSTARHTGLEDAVKDAATTQPAPADVSPASTAYRYLAPTGGEASPYRITDFADDPDPTSPAGLQFTRRYDGTACAPDSWHDWTLTEAQLKSCADKRYASSNNGSPNDPTNWNINGNDKGLVYSFCSVRFGIASGETVGGTPGNAMPLSFIFGEGKISSEKWRIGLAVYLPNGISAASTSPRWMVFAGLSPLTSNTGGSAFPHTASNIELCEALYYNFKTKGVTEFTFIPVMLLNSTIKIANDSASTYKTKVELIGSYNPQLLLTPTFTRCKLTITATPKPGQVEQYSDSAFRGMYSTNLIAGTYKIQVGKTVGSGSGTTLNFKYYKVIIPSGVTIKIEYAASGYGSSGNLKVTASGSNLTYYEYADQTAYGNDTTEAAMSGSPSTVAAFFYTYVAQSAPSNVTPYLMVTKI